MISLWSHGAIWVTLSLKKHKVSVSNEDEVLQENVGNHPKKVACFTPVHFMSDWVEPGTTIRKLTVAILLRSGIQPDMFSVRVSEESCFLELTVAWTDPLANLRHLHWRWLTSKGSDRIKLYHTNLIGFKQILKRCRSGSADSVESTVKTSLQFQVQTHISQNYNLGWSDTSAGVVYVELRGKKEQYGTVHVDLCFEIYW